MRFLDLDLATTETCGAISISRRPPVAGGEAAAAKPLGGGLGGAGAPTSITNFALAYAPGVGENILDVFSSVRPGSTLKYFGRFF